MEVLFILLPATLIIAGMFVALFIFSVNKGQFEELESPANRALFEDTRLEDAKIENVKTEDTKDQKGTKNGSK